MYPIHPAVSVSEDYEDFSSELKEHVCCEKEDFCPQPLYFAALIHLIEERGHDMTVEIGPDGPEPTTSIVEGSNDKVIKDTSSITLEMIKNFWREDEAGKFSRDNGTDCCPDFEDWWKRESERSIRSLAKGLCLDCVNMGTENSESCTTSGHLRRRRFLTISAYFII